MAASRAPESPALNRTGSSADGSTDSLRGSFISDDILNYEPPSTAQGRAKLRGSFGGSGGLPPPSPQRQAAAASAVYHALSPKAIEGTRDGEVSATSTLYTFYMKSDLPVVNGAFCMAISGRTLAVNIKSDMGTDATVLLARSLVLPPDAIPTEVVSSFHDGVVKVQVARQAPGRTRSDFSPGTGPVDTKALTKTTEEMMAELSNMLGGSPPERFQSPTQNLLQDPESVPELTAGDARTDTKRALWSGHPTEDFVNINGDPSGDYEDAPMVAARTPRTLIRNGFPEQTVRQHMQAAFPRSESSSTARDVHLSPGSPSLGVPIGLPTTSTLDEEKAARSAARRAQFINSGLPPPSPATSSGAAADPSPKGQSVESDVLKRCQVSEHALPCPYRKEMLRFCKNLQYDESVFDLTM